MKLDEGNGYLKGPGTALVNLPLEQDSAYWEVLVVENGQFHMGVSRKLEKDKLDAAIGDGVTSWGMDSAFAGAYQYAGNP